MKYLSLALCAALAACSAATPPPEPAIRTVEVKVQVPVPCPALVALGQEPAYADTDSAIQAAQGVGELAKLYATGRVQRMKRLAEYIAVKSACVF